MTSAAELAMAVVEVVKKAVVVGWWGWWPFWWQGL